MAERFTGFPAEGIEFFGQLAAHNDRDWFQAHKDVYERACRAPMQALAAELRPRLGEARITRINRDVRFSRSKAPYKTYIAAGLGGRYISLSGDGLFVGAGLYKPDPPLLQRLRAAIADERTGSRLEAIVASLRRAGYEVGSHATLSSAPRGYARDHPRIELLRMSDIYAGRRFAPAAWLATAGALGRIERVIDDTAPLVDWLKRHAGGGKGVARTAGGKTRSRAR
jgi:uncharacterized protein (TIGR02453 family)